MKPIPYGRQYITEEDIQAVVEVLKAEYLTQGPKIAAFETAFAEYIGSKYAVAVANGTAALHLCTLALGVQPGDKVITTPITFAASANCVRYCGGEVIFADIDPDSYLLDVEKVRTLLEADKDQNYKGIIPVDFAGRPIDMEAFREIADEYGLWIIEDACHAPGAWFSDKSSKRQNCGNGAFADLAIFSFHPVKHIATGEGGMITTNNAVLYQKLLKLRTHGITRNADEFTNSLQFALGGPEIPDSQDVAQWPGWYMEMQDLGFNYRITDFQAALGLSQLQRVETGLERRKAIAAAYESAFENTPYIKGQSGFMEGHAYHLYVIEVENRIGLYNHLRANNIFAQIHYIPCHLMPYYRQFGWKKGDMPNSERYYAQCISLPMYPTLTVQEQEYVIETIKKFYA
ncbi:MAG: UDP-4-amino-4,6-dideoxy-N-acetyl-beta-L-altrosamine transaminase [Saprospiraceae bacterium]